MKLIVALLLCVTCLFAVSPTIAAERPSVNLPLGLRQHNWLGPGREGSCVYATFAMLLRRQGRYEAANWIVSHMGDGEWDERLASRLDKFNISYAYTSQKGDVKFLQWACDTGRGCGVTIMGGKHMVMLSHMDAKWVCLIDNNQPKRNIWVKRKTFIAEWLNSGSWAVTPIYTPATPLP